MSAGSSALARAQAAAPVRTSDVLLLLVAAVWGSSYALAKEAVSLQPVLGFLALRFGLTAALLAPALLREVRRAGVGVLRIGAPLGAVLCAIFLCETYGVARTSAANAAVLISLCVVATPFLEWALVGVRPSRGLLGAAACSVAGVALINGGAAWSLNAGDALILCAALLRAVMVAATRRRTRGYAGSTLALTAVQALVVALACACAAAIADGPSLGLEGPSLRFVLILLWLVLACTIFAFFAQNHAARRTSASRVSLLMGSEPVFGVLFAVAWLGESFTVAAWAGALLIVASCLWAVSRNAV